MRRLVKLAAVCGLAALLVVGCLSTTYGQTPKAVITGPKESPPGELVILDASQSSGLGYLWLLVNSEKSFLPVDDGLRCVFSTGTPGRYDFVLVVAGTNANGGPAAATATHKLSVVGIVPTPPPNPTPPPKPDGKLATVVIVEESGAATVGFGRLLASEKLLSWREKRKPAWHVIDDDVTDESGKPPKQFAPYLKRVQEMLADPKAKVELPVLILDSDSDGANGVLYSGSCSADVDALVTLMEEYAQ